MKWLDGITDSMDNGFGWTPGVGDGQGGLACCGSWGHKESDTTEQLNCVKSLGFSIYGIISSAYSDNFIFSFPIWIPFLHFLV